MNKIMIFHGSNVYATKWMPRSHAICLPGLGIIVSASDGDPDLHLLRHEFGHVLQRRKTGVLLFYLRIGIPSLWSAMRARFGQHRHALHPVEMDANLQAFTFFRSPPDWAHDRFPLPPAHQSPFYGRGIKDVG